MSRGARTALFLTGATAMGLLLCLGFADLPSFGQAQHLYRDLAVHAAFSHDTANVVASVNFDSRALDTLGEEAILFGSVTGVVALLRPAVEEREFRPADPGFALDATRLVGYLLVPVTVALGLDVVVHGHLTPGGGFQGGVMLAAGLHLLYVTGSYQALDRLRPVSAFDMAEALGAAAFPAIGVAGLFTGGAFLANLFPTGVRGELLSAGYQRDAAPPIFVGGETPAPDGVVDPVVQAMTLTDIVIQATVTALLLALSIQIHKRHHTLDPDQLSSLRG